MNYEKITKTAKISEFEKQVKPADYPSIFTENEINRYATKKSKGSMAARYLLKNEIIKKLNLEPKLTDIEIVNDNTGKPVLQFINQSDKNLPSFSFSISHTKNEVAIMLVIEK